MKPEVELREEEKSKVAMVYRRYYRGKWYESETPMPHYNIISFYATKVRTRIYYSSREEAQQRANEYNKHLKAYKKGRENTIPETISWYDFNGTEVQNPLVWWHDSGSWLYAHGYDDWELSELLEDEGDFLFSYDDYGHTTADFLEVLFSTPRYHEYEVRQDNEGSYKIYKK